MENNLDIKELEEVIEKLKLEILSKEEKINELLNIIDEYESDND